MNKIGSATFAAALLALILGVWCVCQVRSLRTEMQAHGISAAPCPTNLEARLIRLEAAAPDVGQTMLGLQLRFAKMYYAAEARNWDLARFEREEVLEDLETVAALKPEEHGVSLTGIITAFTNSAGPLSALKDAIDVSDRGLFRKAYGDCIVMCNACHTSTGRPIVITVPTNAPVFNQRWDPATLGQK